MKQLRIKFEEERKILIEKENSKAKSPVKVAEPKKEEEWFYLLNIISKYFYILFYWWKYKPKIYWALYLTETSSPTILLSLMRCWKECRISLLNSPRNNKPLKNVSIIKTPPLENLIEKSKNRAKPFELMAKYLSNLEWNLNPNKSAKRMKRKLRVCNLLWALKVKEHQNCQSVLQTLKNSETLTLQKKPRKISTQKHQNLEWTKWCQIWNKDWLISREIVRKSKYSWINFKTIWKKEEIRIVLFTSKRNPLKDWEEVANQERISTRTNLDLPFVFLQPSSKNSFHHLQFLNQTQI